LASHNITEMYKKASCKGHNFFCTYFAIATAELFTSMGWTARLVNIANGENRLSPGSGGHMVNDIWSNELGKWYFSDSLHNSHYVKDSIPLSTFEIRREFYKNGGKDIRVAWGVDQIEMPLELHTLPFGFEWFVIYTHNNFLDFPPGEHLFPLLMPRDQYNQGKKWLLRPQGTGDTYVGRGIVKEESCQKFFDYPINHTEIILYKHEGRLKIALHTFTPGLKELQLRINKGEWMNYGHGYGVKFSPPGFSDLQPYLKKKSLLIEARSVNTAGISGPLSTVLLKA